MANSKNWFELLFFLKAHSSFLAATSLASSGQMAETFMVLRGALESPLYRLHIHKNPGFEEIWIKRHNNEKDLKNMKDKFTIGKIFETLKVVEPNLEKIVRTLYGITINYGGHPNPNSLLTILQHNKTEKTQEFKVEYLTGNPLTISLCLKTTAQVGIAGLKLLQLVIPKRFELATLDIKVKKASKGL